jgi:hypothetical protein
MGNLAKRNRVHILTYNKKQITMNIKKIISSASSKTEAISILNTHRIYGTLSDKKYEIARKLITKEFKK